MKSVDKILFFENFKLAKENEDKLVKTFHKNNFAEELFKSQKEKIKEVKSTNLIKNGKIKPGKDNLKHK